MADFFRSGRWAVVRPHARCHDRGPHRRRRTRRAKRGTVQPWRGLLRARGSDMTAARLHAVVSAGIANPALIARWRSDPELLRGHGIEPSMLDLDALWKFAALTIKVRHHALRDELPATFRLMSLAGLEIERFTAYAIGLATRRASFAPTAEGRTLDLLVFLEGWIDHDNWNHVLLWDLIRHERAMGRLARPAPAPRSSPDLWRTGDSVTPAADVVPRVRGGIGA